MKRLSRREGIFQSAAYVCIRPFTGASEEGEIVSYGFTMGEMLMMDMLEEAEAMKIE